MDTNSTETPAAKNLVELAIPTPQGDENKDATAIETYAQSFEIVTASDSLKAQEARARVNTKIKVLTEGRLAQTRPIDEAKKKIMDWWNGPIKALERAKGLFDTKIIAFEREQERIRQEEQRKVEAAAAEERRKLQAKADEELRKSQEKAAAARKAAEDAAAAGRAEEAAKLAAQADKVEAKGMAKAETLVERAATVVAPVIQSGGAKASGSQFRDNWVFTITDPSKINPAFLTPDLVKIGKAVKALKDGAAELIGPGITIKNDKILSTKKVAEEEPA